MSRQRLTKEAILEGAARVIESGGVAQFSMRKLAQHLEVDPMAFYHYFANKQVILQEVLRQYMPEITLDMVENDWKQNLRNLFQLYRDSALKFPEIFQIFNESSVWTRAELDVTEVFYEILQSAGLTEQQVVIATRICFSFAEELCMNESQGWYQLGTEEELIQKFEDGAYPRLRAMSKLTVEADRNFDYEFGVDMLIAGIEKLLAQPKLE